MCVGWGTHISLGLMRAVTLLGVWEPGNRNSLELGNSEPHNYGYIMLQCFEVVLFPNILCHFPYTLKPPGGIPDVSASKVTLSGLPSALTIIACPTTSLFSHVECRPSSQQLEFRVRALGSSYRKEDVSEEKSLSCSKEGVEHWYSMVLTLRSGSHRVTGCH